MELITNNTFKQRTISAIDLASVLLIGLGLGISFMYWYVSAHPVTVTQRQSTIIVVPQKATSQNSTGKVITTKPAVKYEQI